MQDSLLSPLTRLSQAVVLGRPWSPWTLSSGDTKQSYDVMGFLSSTFCVNPPLGRRSVLGVGRRCIRANSASCRFLTHTWAHCTLASQDRLPLFVASAGKP